MKDNGLETIYEALCEQAKSKRTRNSLSIIRNACIAELQSKTNDFSIVNIGHLSEQQNGPKAQAIRNKTGKLYRDLIAAYSDSVKSNKPVIPKSENDWVDNIEDVTTRWLVVDLIHENKKLKGINDVLKNDLKNTEHPIQINYSDGNTALTSPTLGLKNGEIDTLKNAIDTTKLTKLGLSVHKRGGIEDATGKRLFGNGFVDAIKRILTLSGDSADG